MTEQPMTRRQRREAERAAERAAQRQARMEAPTVSLPEGLEVPADPAPSTGVSHGPVRLVRVGRAAVLGALAVATVAVPLGGQLGLPLTARASAALATPAATAPTLPALGGPQGSLAAEVLGTDADLADGEDTELSNVPDAATRARIKEAYVNAKVTCAAKTAGASGDGTAFDSKPTLFVPMVKGTYTLSSPYGYRIHPTLGYLKLHAGQDMAAPAGTPIYAAAAGKVLTAGMVGETGIITIQHEIDGKTWYTRYLHMYADGIYVHVGDQVSAGQLIAGVGSTGRSTGPHLHFEVRTANEDSDDVAIEPNEWLKEHHAAELTTDCR